MTLLQSLAKFLENISLSDRQEDVVDAAYDNLKDYLYKDCDENNLAVTDVFQNGSYWRDTIIRPNFDIDVYVVIDKDEYVDHVGETPNPQTVLTRFKKYLNEHCADYKDKCSQSRPCITISLSKLTIDVMPAIVQGGAYYIPNESLDGWNFSDPKTHNETLKEVHRRRDYKVKPIIKMVKKWKRDNASKLPSFHVEEIACSIFNIHDITNYRDGVETWFNNAEGYLRSGLCGTYNQYEKVRDAIRDVKKKLNDVKDKDEDEAKKVWKEIFGRDFPVIDESEAKEFSKSLEQGTLRFDNKNGLTTSIAATASSIAVAASKGFYGE